MNRSKAEKTKKINDAYLLDYAAGNLDAAESLLVACYLDLNPTERHRLSSIESLCGALLSECHPSQTDSSLDQCWDNILEHIAKDEPSPPQSETPCFYTTPCTVFPPHLQRYIGKDIHSVSWVKLTKNIHYLPLIEEGENKAYLIKAPPQNKIASHSHRKTEITLLLQGHLHDKGQEYTRGDLVIFYPESSETHNPQTSGQEECICLITNLDTIRLNNPIWRIFQFLTKLLR